LFKGFTESAAMGTLFQYILSASNFHKFMPKGWKSAVRMCWECLEMLSQVEEPRKATSVNYANAKGKPI